MAIPVFNNGQVFTNHPNDKNFAGAYDDPLVYFGASKTVYPEETLLDTRCPLQMFITGNNAKGTLQEAYDLRPATGVLAAVKDLREPRKCEKKPKINSCKQVTGYSYTYLADPVTGKLLHSDDPRIRAYGRTPNGNGAQYFNITEGRTKTSTTLTVIKKNIIRSILNVYEIHFYYGILDPLDEPENTGELVTVDFVFSPVFNPTDKLYMWGWYVRVLQDGTNEFLEQDDIDALVYGS